MKRNQVQNNQDLGSLYSSKIEAFKNFYTATLLLEQTIKEKNIIKIEALVNLRDNQIENIDLIDQEIKGQSGRCLQKNKYLDGLLTKLQKVMEKAQTLNNDCVCSALVLLKENSESLTQLGRELNAFYEYKEKQGQKLSFLDVKT
jgi:hypothetical protein